MANDFSVIETGGKQYRVSSGQKLRVEKLVTTGGVVSFDKVLLRSTGGRLEVGAPYIAGAKVAARVVGDVRGRKQIVFKFHSKTRQHKKKGHRQNYTEIEIQ